MKWTSEEAKAKVRAYREARWTFSAIARSLGVCKSTVARLAQQMGLPKQVVRTGPDRPPLKPTKDPAILLYRREKKAGAKRLAPVLREAKQELERQMAYTTLRKNIDIHAKQAKRRSA